MVRRTKIEIARPLNSGLSTAVQWLLTGLALLLAFLCSAGGHAFAQEEGERPDLYIRHEAVEQYEMPKPGEPLVLTAEVRNTNEATRSMRALINVDGRLIDVPMTEVRLNKYDYPEYSIEVNAPKEHMTYRFILYDHDGSAMSSSRYSISQNCAVDLTPVDPEFGTDLQGTERLDVMVLKAQSLKREINAYNHARKLLEELKAIVKK